MTTKGPWWNPLLDAEVKAVCVYGPVRTRSYKWWERLLIKIGLRRFVKVPKRMLNQEEAALLVR